MNTFDTTFNWKLLWPDILTLITGNISCTDGFSALIVFILWCIFGTATGVIIFKFKKVKQAISFYRDIIKEFSPENLMIQRRTAISKAMKKDKALAQLWKEFDDSLVESSDGKRLLNTVDAAQVFNTFSLSSGITENRLIAAVPGFLTAIGVIGTFAGLQLGLSGLDLSDEGMKAASHEINRLISSAAVAFLTSVWGVLTSVVFNFIEKVVERYIRSDIYSLQLEIDQLFPRNNAQQSLILIEDHNKETRKALQGLAEKIGNKMQEAVSNVSENLQGGLKEFMAPAIEQFVSAANELTKRQAKNSEEVLATILETFMDGVSKESSSQRQLTEKLNTDLNSSIDTLINQLNSYNERSKELDEERFSALSNNINELTQKQSSAINYAVNETTKTANGFVKQIEDQFEKIAKQEQERISLLNSQLKSLREGLQLFMVSMNKSTEQNISASEAILEQGKILSDSVSNNQKSMDIVSKRIEKSGQFLDNAASKLESLGENLGAVVQLFAESLLESNKVSTRLSEENLKVSSSLKEVLETILNIKNDFTKVSEILGKSSQIAKDEVKRFSEHHESFQKTLTDHINELEKLVAKLLNDYASQVQSQTEERMNEWNRHTADFATTMRDAIYTISDVVNEIEDKISTLAD